MGAIHKKLLGLQNRLAAAYGTDISTPEARRAAWWHFQLMDHAFLRVWWTNLEEFAPGVWRSNQPSPQRLEHWAGAFGLKTVVNLRGTPMQGFYLFECEVTEKLGLTRIDLNLSARRAPPREGLLQVLDVLEGLQTPALIHCKSGADRTGLVAALYLLQLGRPLAEAKRQLSFRYLHLKSTRTGIMDLILTMYGEEANGRSFRAWASESYDPVATEARFTVKGR